jgi:hypothetical protein
MSGVSRFKICTFELGSGSLSAEEQELLRKALHNEANRLRSVSNQVDLSPDSGAESCASESDHQKPSTEQP